MKSSHDHLIFDSLRLEGSIFLPAVLDAAAQGESSRQTLADYQLAPGLTLLEEQGRAFRIAQSLWETFMLQLKREDMPARKVTTGFVTEFFRLCLGYTGLEVRASITTLQERDYPVQAFAAAHLPLVIAEPGIELDEASTAFAITGASHTHKNSPHRVLQQFLNATDLCLWGFVANGTRLRILRDADSLTRPAYLEFDLEKIFQEKRYADFRALWLLLHVSRSGKPGLPAECVWEHWREEGHDLGTRVRDGLRDGVTRALIVLGNGFLKHPANDDMRQSLNTGGLDAEILHQEILRLIYRFLLVFSVEERELLHPPTRDPDQRRIADIYRQGYSLRRLRERALRRSGFDQHSDLWESVRILFRGLREGEPRLGLPALGGLFADTQCPHLEGSLLRNRDLLEVMRCLRWASADGRLSPVDYKNMGPEELGSVYESLLELVPVLDLSTLEYGYAGLTDDGSTDGNARKLSGSYYTPDPLVQNLLDTALDPVLRQRLNDNPENPEAALLSLKVIDPACGSGHFLLGAARRIAERLADIRAQGEAVTSETFRHALRDVISHCLYGVDRNPLAVELARSALWIESYDPGQPLSFLDAHLQIGDALLGILSFDQLKAGIPADAFKALSGDHKAVVKDLAAKNKGGGKELAQKKNQQAIQEELTYDSTQQENLLHRLQDIENMPERTVEDCARKEAAYTEFQDSAAQSQLHHACDLFVAAFLHTKTPESKAACPINHDLLACLRGEDLKPGVLANAQTLCRESSVFHWPLRFAQVFARGGFDCVLGNPPWERIKIQEKEFFASRSPAIANAPNKAARDRMIAGLHTGSDVDQRLHREFTAAKRLAEANSVYAHVNGADGGRFPFTGQGDVNTYALFAETMGSLTAPNGRAGFIVPTGICTDNTTKDFFADLVKRKHLVSLYDFENREGIFPGVHKSYKFCLMTLGPAEIVQFAFFLLRIEHLDDSDRQFTLSAEDFALINPNTLTCPVFRSQADAELTKKIYRNIPVLWHETEEEGNPWGLHFSAMFHMSNDSHLFLDEPAGNCLPLYEAKMMHQFDHRWATYEFNSETRKPEARDFRPSEKQNPDLEVRPRYWVEEKEVIARIADAPKSVIDAWLQGSTVSLLTAFANWIAAELPESLDELRAGNPDQDILKAGGARFADLPSNWRDSKAMAKCKNHPPLTPDELHALQSKQDLHGLTTQLLDHRSPRWLMGWRDITNATNERTVIASVIPRVGANHKILLIRHGQGIKVSLISAYIGNLSSLILDFVARQKVGGTSLSYHYMKQFPILPPETYTQSDLDFIVPRVLELTYTSHALKPWAEDLGYDGPPFAFDPDRRAVLRAELDALYARLYGLTRDELRYILDPADTHGPDYPTETFRGLKTNDLKAHNEYRTQRLVLEAWDRMEEKTVVTIPQSWRDDPYPVKQLKRIPVAENVYRNLVTEQLCRLDGNALDILVLLRACWFLSEPEKLHEAAVLEELEIPGNWWAARSESLDFHRIFNTLHGFVTVGQLSVQKTGGTHLVSWKGSHMSHEALPQIQDDARVALLLADLAKSAVVEKDIQVVLHQFLRIAG